MRPAYKRKRIEALQKSTIKIKTKNLNEALCIDLILIE